MGLLHLEMNAAQSFIKLNWDVFTESIGFELGFKSPKALEYLRKGSDHHKTWQFLEILYQSITQELVTPYIKECIEKGDVATVEGYWKWSNTVSDPNYIYSKHMSLTYLHSLMVLRSGVRKSNSGLVDSATSRLSHLFYARNHPIYHNYLDLKLMPTELKALRLQYITVSQAEKVGKCQGGDALLEETNKDSKSWLKASGVPTEEQWLRVFRNLDNLTKLKKKTMQLTENGKRKTNDSSVIWKVRMLIRRNKYFVDPKSSRPRVSLSGENVSEQLVEFRSFAEKNIFE